MAAGGNRHGIESGVTMVAQGFRDAALYHMSAKDTLHDVGITGITTFGTGIAFDILSRPGQALVRKFRGTVGISGCSEAAEGAGKSAGGTSDSPYIPDDEDIALEKMYDEQGKPCEEYEDYLGEIRKHVDEPAPKVTIKGGDGSGFVSNIDTVLRKQNLTIDEFNTLRLKSVSELSPDEIAKMKAIRDSVPKINSSTVIKKQFLQVI